MTEVEKLQQLIGKKNKTHLVFDLDRTIAELLIDWSHWRSGVLEVIYKLDPKPNKEAFLKNIYTYVNSFIKEYGNTAEQAIKKFNQDYETKYLTGLTPNKPLLAFNQSLPQNYSLYVYSSNSKKTDNFALNQMQLISRFNGIVSRDDVTFIKPHPQGFSFILNPDVKKSSYLMIGDSPSDQGVAHEAGIDFFQVNYFNKNNY
jgi:phosphoglycolate phosphatase-like HAD superfamily hydrolase